ncbi:MAG: response regulator [Planctomycetaceae bacterium]|nr:response regulator [Planctomycetaceae bacterium]
MRVSSWLVACLPAVIFLSPEFSKACTAQPASPTPLATVSQPAQSPPPADVQQLLQQSVKKLYEAPEQVIELSQKVADLAYKSSNTGAYAAAMAQRSCARVLTQGPLAGQPDFIAAMDAFPRDPDRISHIYFLHALCLRARLMRSAAVVSCTEGLRKDLKILGSTLPDELALIMWSEVLWTEASRVEVPFKRRHSDFTNAIALADAAKDRFPSQAWFVRLVRYCSKCQAENDASVLREKITSSLNSPEFQSLPVLWKIAATENLLSLDRLTHERAMTEHLRTTLATLAFSTPYPPVRAAYASYSSLPEHQQYVRELLTSDQKDLSMVPDPDVLLDLSRQLGAGLVSSENPVKIAASERITSHSNRLMGLDRAASALIASKASFDLDKLQQAQVEQSALLKEVLVDGSSHAWWSDFWMAVAGVVVVSLFVLMLMDQRALRNINEQLSLAIQKAEQQRSERERMELRIAQTERLESLGTLAGGVAHDFNNLLVGVLGNADLLKLIVPEDPQIEECIEGIIRSAETAAELSRKMLVYAGKEPSRKCVVDLNQVIGRMLPLLRSGLSCRHLIEFSPGESACMTEADTGQLEQILMNLVSNSAQAMQDAHGRVTLRTGEMSIANVAELSRLQLFGNRTCGGRFVWFEVTDSGVGISEADLSRLFQPFFTTRSRTQGHGFGLSVVYGHVNRHDGLIQVISRPGEGTTFRILLPQTDSTASIDTNHDDLSDSGATAHVSHGTIVAVDDQQTVLDVVQRACERSGLRANVFRSATEALEFIADTPGIDCLLLDMMMPEFDGHAMLEELYQRGIHIPVIVMSGYSQTNAEDYSMFPNVRMTMQKPFRKTQLIRAIRSIVAENPVSKVAENDVAQQDLSGRSAGSL